MNLIAVSLRNVRVRALSSILTTLATALGAALLAALWLLIAETERRYRAHTAGYDVVVGPKEGAPLSLVLNTVFNLGFSPGVVPMAVYRELHDDPRLKRLGTIRYAIPQARGDSYKGFPIVGTTDEMFGRFQRGKDAERKPVLLAMAAGRAWSFGHDDLLAFAEEVARQKGGDGHEIAPGDGHEHEHEPTPSPWHEVVVGATVARDLRLEVGARITPVHGLSDDITAHVHAEDRCEVVGILAATGTPLDRTIFLPLRTFLAMDRHEAIRDTQAAEAGNVQLSAVLVGCVAEAMREKLRYEFQGRRDAQAAVPITEVTGLLQIIGNATDVLRVVSWLVIVVAATSILVGLYNTMNERRREIAIMRSLGARRGQIVRVILQEALLVSLAGGVLGVALCHGAAFFLAGTVERLAGVAVDWAAFSLAELWLILGVGAVGALAGALPAVKGSLTPVAENLGPLS